jgi:hypothetical protein
MSVTDRILGEAMTPWQKKIYTDPKKACAWAIKAQRRFPEAEPYISKDPYWGLMYAGKVIKGRWPEAEDAIAENDTYSLWYAEDVLKGRFPEGEETIASGGAEHRYIHVFPAALDDWIKKGWYVDAGVEYPDREVATLFFGPEYASKTRRKVVANPKWLLSKNLFGKAVYSMIQSGERFPELEDQIAKSGQRKSYLERFPEAKDEWIMNGWADWLDT